MTAGGRNTRPTAPHVDPPWEWRTFDDLADAGDALAVAVESPDPARVTATVRRVGHGGRRPTCMSSVLARCTSAGGPLRAEPVPMEEGALPAVLLHLGGCRHHRGRPWEPAGHGPSSPGPEGADHQPDGGPLLGSVRRGAVRRCSAPPRRRPGRAERHGPQRLDDDGLRRDGPGHGVQRPDEPARPRERSHPRRP
jgi:hypothetical protein